VQGAASKVVCIEVNPDSATAFKVTQAALAHSNPVSILLRHYVQPGFPSFQYHDTPNIWYQYNQLSARLHFHSMIKSAARDKQHRLRWLAATRWARVDHNTQRMSAALH
jgi:hypothetical protein